MSLEKIKQVVGAKGFIEDQKEIEPHVTAWRGRFKGKSPLVVFPKTTEEVSDILKICSEAKIPVVPQGGNTGLVAGGIPTDKGDEIIINLSRMTKVVELDKEDFTVTAEAGVILKNLQDKCATAGLYFPVSLASEGSCMLGGIVATNAGGNNVIKYGNTRENVLGLEVVLPSGEVVDGIKYLRKDNTGYDLKQLFIGSEGTLGIITKAVFRLFAMARQKETLFIAVDNIGNVSKVFSSLKSYLGEKISAFEFISQGAMETVTKHIDAARNPFASAASGYLLIEVVATEEGDFLKGICEKALEKTIESGLVADAIIATSLAQSHQFWHIREHITESIKKAGRGIPFDISVAISHIAEFVEKTSSAISKKFPAVKLVPFGHVGDGNIHFNMFFPKEMADA